MLHSLKQYQLTAVVAILKTNVKFCSIKIYKTREELEFVERFIINRNESVLCFYIASGRIVDKKGSKPMCIHTISHEMHHLMVVLAVSPAGDVLLPMSSVLL